MFAMFLFTWQSDDTKYFYLAVSVFILLLLIAQGVSKFILKESSNISSICSYLIKENLLSTCYNQGI